MNELGRCCRFQSPISVIHDEQPIASTITVVPHTMKNVTMESSHSSILHLTTAIDDDDDELFSTTRRKMPIAQVTTSSYLYPVFSIENDLDGKNDDS